MSDSDRRRLEERGVLFIAENTGIGGINSYLISLGTGLRQRGINVEITAVWPKEDDWLGAKCREFDIPLTILADRRSVNRLPGCVFRLASRIRRQRYAIVHSQAHYSGLVSRSAHLISGRQAKLVATVHSTFEDPRLGLRAFMEADLRTMGWNHAVIANSQYTANFLTQLGINPSLIHVILLGLVTAADAACVPLKTLNDTCSTSLPQIGFVGRLSWEKGCLTLIEAARLLRDRGRRFELFLVGVGPEQALLEHRVAEFGLAEQVTFSGWQTDVQPYYRRADVLAVPSVHESLGLTALEGMLQGRPVVVSRVGGVPEIVVNEETGLLVEPGDPVELANAIEHCLLDPALRSRLGQAARRHVISHHTVERMVDQTIELFDRILGPAAGTGRASLGHR